ncbi:MAG: GGDEF domain-containing response regulator [Candidatus Geothermincolia bacterium]
MDIRQRQRRILLADDNKLVVKVTGAILEDAGFQVDVAWDGMEAVLKAFALVPDLIILDIEMPRLKGYQVCRLLKDDPATGWIPIIMLTGRELPSDKFWGLKTGADAYMTKGFKPEELLDEVRRLANGSRPPQNGRPQPREITEEYVISKLMNLLDQKLFETTVVNEIAALTGSIQEYAETARSVFEILTQIVNYGIGMLFMMDKGDLFVYLNRPATRGTVEQAESIALGIAEDYGWDARKGESVKERLFREELVKDGGQEGALDLIHIPLNVRKRVEGVLALAAPANATFKRDAPALLKLIQAEATVVLDNASLYEDVKLLAVTDGLTKIYNHRFFQEVFEREFKRADRYRTGFALIMLDIDHFKLINDTYGHLYGDLILKELADLIKSCLRSMDIVARYGGEEFAVLLPETSLKEAELTAERIRRSVEEYAFAAAEGKGIRITVSQGVTAYPGPDVTNRNDLVAKADGALYRAKGAGRNRVLVQP